MLQAKLLGVTGLLEDHIMRVKFLAIALDDPKADMIDSALPVVWGCVCECECSVRASGFAVP